MLKSRSHVQHLITKFQAGSITISGQGCSTVKRHASTRNVRLRLYGVFKA